MASKIKYVLVDNFDNITHQKDFDSDMDESSIKEYFIKLKARDASVQKLDEKVFDKVWKVMTEKRYDEIKQAALRSPSSSHGEFGDWLDYEKS